MLGKLISKDKNFYETVARVAIPIALQSLITVGVNMMDTIMVGRVGEMELSAVSLANTFINIYHILCMGLSMGASVMVSRFFGMGNQRDMKKSVAIMLRLTVLIASLFAAFMFAAPAASFCKSFSEIQVLCCLLAIHRENLFIR